METLTSAACRHICVSQVKNISVQSSVSLQHLPYDKHLEKNIEASIAGRLAFATQKLEEIVKAAQDAPALKPDQIKAGLPQVGELQEDLQGAAAASAGL